MLRRPAELGQYTSLTFTRPLASEGLVGSMGTVGDALDNAMCESLIGTMKIERLNRQPWRSIEDVRAAVFESIETWYNRRRRHSSLGSSHPWSSRANTTTDTRSPTPNPSAEPGEAHRAHTPPVLNRYVPSRACQA